jgi:hypothetical protein
LLSEYLVQLWDRLLTPIVVAPLATAILADPLGSLYLRWGRGLHYHLVIEVILVDGVKAAVHVFDAIFKVPFKHFTLPDYS